MAYPGPPPQWGPPPSGPVPQWGPPPPGPEAMASAAKAHKWFRVYSAAMVVLYLLCIVGGLFLLLYDFEASETDVGSIRFQGAALLVVSVLMIGLYAVGTFLPERPWGWAFGLVLIGLGLTSCCTWPATIPLLLAWLKPGMKAHFKTG